MAQIWITKRRGKTGVRYLVRWIEPVSGSNRGKTFKRREDAEAFKVELRQRTRNRGHSPVINVSFGRWIDEHVDNMRNAPDLSVAEKTIDSHREALESLQKTCHPQRLEDVSPAMIRHYRRKLLKKKGNSPNTINKHIRTIRSALSYAVRDGYLATNNLLGPHRLEIQCDNVRGRVLDVEEVKALMEKATDIESTLVVSLAYYHGLCKGEIAWLRWPDVDVQDYRLTVANQNGHRLKTKNRTCSVALRQETAAILEEIYSKRRDKKNLYVFGDPQRFYRRIQRLIPGLAKKAGIDHCTLHDLRRTCNTLMKDEGEVSEEVVTQVTGNTQVVNRRHYTAELKKQQRIAVDSLPSIG